VLHVRRLDFDDDLKELDDVRGMTVASRKVQPQRKLTCSDTVHVKAVVLVATSISGSLSDDPARPVP
jgi:hypothetical protein